MSSAVAGSPSTPVSELGRKLFLRSVSTSVDETLGKQGEDQRRSTSRLGRSAKNHNEDAYGDDDESASEDEEEVVASRQRARRRSSIAGARIASQIPSRTIVDSRFVVSPQYAYPAFDVVSYKINKDLYFFHRPSDTQPYQCVFRIEKLAKGILGAPTWQIYAGSSEPLAVIKQVARTLSPTFFLFRGTDAKKGEVVYTFRKKARSTKIRVFTGEGYKETALLTYFCLLGDDRLCIKLKDASAIGGEALGETIMDWRVQTSILRIGKGFDICLAAASFCIADSVSPHSLQVPAEIQEVIMQSVRVADRSGPDQSFRQVCGW